MLEVCNIYLRNWASCHVKLAMDSNDQAILTREVLADLRGGEALNEGIAICAFMGATTRDSLHTSHTSLREDCAEQVEVLSMHSRFLRFHVG